MDLWNDDVIGCKWIEHSFDRFTGNQDYRKITYKDLKNSMAIYRTNDWFASTFLEPVVSIYVKNNTVVKVVIGTPS